MWAVETLLSTALQLVQLVCHLHFTGDVRTALPCQVVHAVHASRRVYPLAFVALHQLLLFTVRKEYTVHESGGIVVTGASTGIGRHAALALAKKGYVVYAGCRKVHCMHVCSVHTTA